MGIKITYTDTDTGAVLRETELDEAEKQAFEYVACSVVDWIDNCFQNRARQAINEVVVEALGTDTKVTLSDSDKTNLASRIGVVNDPKSILIADKKEIVIKSVFESAKERTNKPKTS
tara:strand:+ start:59 stop:409 length:351 start_codon:yes stop_codon:yes gene_type:complete